MPRNPPAASTRADFEERKEFVMAYDKKKLAAGVKEMRSVAKRLTTWADDLEKLLTSENSEVNEDAGSRTEWRGIYPCQQPNRPCARVPAAQP